MTRGRGQDVMVRRHDRRRRRQRLPGEKCHMAGRIRRTGGRSGCMMEAIRSIMTRHDSAGASSVGTDDQIKRRRVRDDVSAGMAAALR